VANSNRDSTSPKTLSEIIKKLVPFHQAVVLTAVPRGALQLASAGRLPTGFVKGYSSGAHAEDRLSWQSILRKRPVQPGDCWSGESFLGSVYSRELMVPAGLTHAVALPLAAPLLSQYPGSLHLLRTAEQGVFTSSQIATAMSAVKAFDQRVATTRSSHPAQSGSSTDPSVIGLTIFDAKLRVQYGADGWARLDPHIKDQMLDHARRRLGNLNSHGMHADRAQFPDARSNVWTFRVVTYKRYPAIADGACSFFCPQPACTEWLSVKAADFQADPEMARLIPALKFMAQEFRDGPSLSSIAQVADLSPFHFHRRFADLLGMTPKQFMLDCQIHECKSALMDGKSELVDIARENGFAHQSHFTSRFKQATGQTPTRWRRTVSAIPASKRKR
jgi:AraC-like DNA-binding protein